MTDVFSDDKSGEKKVDNGKDNQNQGSKTDNPKPLDALVGDGKKYKDAGDLVQGYNAGQEHITKIEAENATLRETAEKAKGVQDVLDAVAAANTGQGDALDSDKVAQMIQDGIAANTQQAHGNTNQERVNAKMVELFGDKAGQSVATRAMELGMSVEAMKGMARISPDAVIALFMQAGGTQQKGSEERNPSKSTINTDTLQNQNTEEGTYGSYATKRCEMNKEKAGEGDRWYFSAKTQNEMTQAGEKGGEKFFG